MRSNRTMPCTAVVCERDSQCDLTNGGSDCVQEDVLLYGGEGAGDLRPEFVPKLNWLLATDFMPGFSGTVCFVHVFCSQDLV